MGKGPLAGIRLVEMDAIGPVPLAGMLLSDLGADVVRIVRPRRSGESGGGGSVLGRGKRELALDLKQTIDRDKLMALIGCADALVEGARPGVMERLGLGPVDCHARNPRLVYTRVTGWGQEGRLAKSAGHDLNYLAMSGMLHAIGKANEPPTVPLNLIADYGGGTMFAALGLVSAILHARQTGHGQTVDVAMVDGVVNLAAMFQGFLAAGLWIDRREENLLDGGRPFYRCYACSDGLHMSVGALEPQFFALLVSMLGFEPDRFVQHDPAGWPAMQQAFAEVFATRTRDAWAEHFFATDACVAPVLSISEAMTHPVNQERHVFVIKDGISQANPAPRFSHTPGAIGEASSTTIDDAIARWA